MASKRRLMSFLMLGLMSVLALKPSVFGQEAITLLAIYPSDQTVFTQGFEVHPQLAAHHLLLGTGLYGESSIGVLDIETGNYQIIDSLDKEYFGEGLTITEDSIWQLTWKENTAFKRDLANFEVIETATYSGEGWGLAFDQEGQALWMSNGTNQLTLRDPDTFDIINTLDVTYNNKAVSNLNELEFANGLIYANIWLTDQIVTINPNNGFIEHVYDLKALLEEVNQQYTAVEIAKMDVLNGIAHKEGNVFYLTGKQYPYVLEVELTP